MILYHLTNYQPYLHHSYMADFIWVTVNIFVRQIQYTVQHNELCHQL